MKRKMERRRNKEEEEKTSEKRIIRKWRCKMKRTQRLSP
jgi:hypothetical protein